jgi:hypothetical protein
MSDLFTIEPSPRPALAIARERLAKAQEALDKSCIHIINACERWEAIPYNIKKEHSEARCEVYRLEEAEFRKT